MDFHVHRKYNLVIPFGIQYKGFDVSVMFQGSLNSSILLNGAAVWDFPSYEQDQYGKVKHMHLNRWTEATKDVATYPRLTYGAYENNKNGNSSLFLYNANYIRLKNLEVGYSLPKNIIRFCRFAKCTLLCTRFKLTNIRQFG